MRSALSLVRAVVPLVVAAGLAAGCNSSGEPGTAEEADQAVPVAQAPEDRVLFDTDFEGVCSGAPQAGAAAYDKARPGIHPVLGFSSSTIDVNADKLSALTIPEGFTRRWKDGSNTLAEVELVVCARRTTDTVVRTCDGYQRDGKDTGQVVTLHSAGYEVTLHAAKTGEKVAGTTIETPATDCPTIIMGDRKDDYPDPADAVVEFIQPYVKTG